MKQYLLLTLTCLCLLPLEAQTVFNKLIPLEFPVSRFMSVLPTDTSYYIIGTFTDSLFRAGALWGKTDLEGDLLSLTTFRHPERDYFNDYGDIRSTKDGFLYNAGSYNESPNTEIIFYLYNQEGDTLLTRRFKSILYPSANFVVPINIYQRKNGGYAIVAVHDTSENPENSEISFLLIDSNYLVEAYLDYAHSPNHEIPNSLLLDEDDGYIIGAERTNEGQVFNNFENRTLLIKTDSLGNQQWQWLSPEGVLQDGAHAMIKTPDGGLVVASGQGIEWGTNPNYHYLFWDALIFKLDADRNVVWSTPFRGYHPSPQTTLTEMVEAQDGSGFVASGIVAEKEGDEPAYHTSWLVKVSSEGDSLWARRYTYFDGEFVAPEVWDMKTTPDGGYVLVGTAPQVFDINTNPYIPAWIMKVDSFGCLIPGCQLDDTTAISGSPEQTTRLAIFPNPASDFLHIELRSAPSTGSFAARIVDANGKTMTEIPAVSAHTTYTLPVWQWPPGVYFLQLLHDGVPVRTERFVVGR